MEPCRQNAYLKCIFWKLVCHNRPIDLKEVVIFWICWGMTQLAPAITCYDHCIHSTVDSDIIVFAHSQAMFHKICKIWDFKKHCLAKNSRAYGYTWIHTWLQVTGERCLNLYNCFLSEWVSFVSVVFCSGNMLDITTTCSVVRYLAIVR